MSRRTAIGWALLFSIPPGIGVTAVTATQLGNELLPPLAILAGSATAIGLFAVVYVLASTGSADESRRDESGS